MSSTEDAARARRFFEEHLLPAAERLRARGVRFFPLGPTDEEASWYAGPPEIGDFMELEAEGIEQTLRSLWASQDLPELEALTPHLLELARSLEVRDQEESEVSPFVYVMY
jgi:hypothetical protein